MSQLIRLSSLFFLLSSFLSCGPTPLFEATDDLGDAGWAYPDSLDYAFTVSDSEARYDLQLVVEHTTAFPYQNFYVELTTELPDGQRLTQPVSLQLSDKFGRWYGDCSGDDCTSVITIQQGMRFQPTGNYKLTVKQHSREAILGEVTGMGLRVVPVEG